MNYNSQNKYSNEKYAFYNQNFSQEHNFQDISRDHHN